jgi:hypothetical protein
MTFNVRFPRGSGLDVCLRKPSRLLLPRCLGRHSTGSFSSDPTLFKVRGLLPPGKPFLMLRWVDWKAPNSFGSVRPPNSLGSQKQSPPPPARPPYSVRKESKQHCTLKRGMIVSLRVRASSCCLPHYRNTDKRGVAKILELSLSSGRVRVRWAYSGEDCPGLGLAADEHVLVSGSRCDETLDLAVADPEPLLHHPGFPQLLDWDRYKLIPNPAYRRSTTHGAV